MFRNNCNQEKLWKKELEPLWGFRLKSYHKNQEYFIEIEMVWFSFSMPLFIIKALEASRWSKPDWINGDLPSEWWLSKIRLYHERFNLIHNELCIFYVIIDPMSRKCFWFTYHLSFTVITLENGTPFFTVTKTNRSWIEFQPFVIIAFLDDLL